MVVGFCSIGGYMLLRVMVVGFDKNLAQSQGGEMYPGLFQDL